MVKFELDDAARKSYRIALTFLSKNGCAMFADVDENNNFIYKGKNISDDEKPSKWPIPDREIRRLNRALDLLHKAALDEERTSEELRVFFRDFKIPSPRKVPEAYRLVGMFRPRLVVCWGCGKNEDYELPLTKNAKEACRSGKEGWESEGRIPVAKLFRSLKKFLCKLFVASLVVGAVAGFAFGIPVHCHHGNVVGRGIGGRFFVRQCPKVCMRCGLHLDADLSCPKCRCKICGAKRELTREGICAHPPKEETCSATVGSENAHRCGQHCKPAKPGSEPRCSACLSTEL